MKHTPPRFLTQLLRWFANVEFLEEIEGDLHEQFSMNVEQHGMWRAKLYYAQDVMHALHSYPVKRQGTGTHSQTSLRDVVGHFFKLTFRNMARNKASTFINIAGLAFSLTSFLLIGLYLIDELTFDQFHPNAENVYRIGHSYKRFGDGIEETDARSAGLWSVAMKEAMPEIKRFTRFSRFGYPGKVQYEKVNKVFVEQQFFWADSTFGDMFHVEILQGGATNQILRDPTAVIVTEEIAKKYFGEQEALGQTLVYNRDGLDIPLIVSGIMKPFPTNSHFHPEFIASNLALDPLWKKNDEDRVNSWRDAFTYSYLQVNDGTTEADIAASLRKIFDTHLGDDAKNVWPSVVRMTDIHFTPGKVIELEATGDKNSLYIFGSIGLLILVIASINYMNLATARSIKRSREVGLRKTLGVSRAALITHFIGESLFITTFSFVVAIALFALLLPTFNEITSKQFAIAELFQSHIALTLIALIFVIGIVSGTYPAFYLSSFDPLQVLKGKMPQGLSAENFRKALVVFQFSITLFLIAGTLVINQQLDLINKSKLNESQDQMLTIRLTGLVEPSSIEAIAQQLGNNPHVDDIALGTHLPRREHWGWIDARFKAASVGETEYMWQVIDCSSDFPRLFNLELVHGRKFTDNRADSSNVLINESVLTDLHLDANQALGVVLEDVFTKKKKTIIGIVKDFSYASVRKKIQPLILNCNIQDPETMYIKLIGTNYPEAVQSIEETWKKISPAAPFEYSFLNEQFASLYRGERQMRSIVTYFAVLAIAIGCLGLFGLASFTAEQKRKEIGIRKVLGATSRQILISLTSRFAKLVLVSCVIGIPLTYVFIERWLQNFEYRIQLDMMLFVIPATSILVLTCITVGLESLRASMANPVESIRNE